MKGRKTGVREKGTPNVSSLDAKAIAARIGVDPFEILCLIAKGDMVALGEPVSLDQRLTAAVQATKYLHQQRKAVELSSDDKGFQIVIKDYTTKGY